MVSGTIQRIAGSIIEAKDMKGCKMFDEVKVGPLGLIGEIIKLEEDIAFIQVFEDTLGLKIGDVIESKNEPLSAELGPGLIGSVFDGIQRPIKNMDMFIKKGERPKPLDEKKKWAVKKIKDGAVKKGEIIAEVDETSIIKHKILSPHDGSVEIHEGIYTINEPFGKIIIPGEKGSIIDIPLILKRKWPVKEKTEIKRKLVPGKVLITGQRVIDTLFPVAKGGSAALPGGFGAGKTIATQEIAKWADADIIVMALVGERGNECADVLNTFPKITDVKTGKSIMERSVIIANSSNMPVAARISSIYFATAISEYYRNMGYSILLIVDSTSRWAEALREISGKLEEMPGEEGYPVYLASKIADLYERSGVVETTGGITGSLTIIGAVSPPGGDFSEPVTQATKSVVKCLWALSTELAYHRHYPSIDWMLSYSNYIDNMKIEISKYPDWLSLRSRIMKILQEEEELEKIVRLVGYDSLPQDAQFILEIAKLFRENFLQQDAFIPNDAFCSLKKQYGMLKIFIKFYESGLLAMKHGKSVREILDAELVGNIARMKFSEKEDFNDIDNEIDKKLLEDSTGIKWDNYNEDGI